MQNNPERVRSLLVDHKVDPNSGDNAAVSIATINGFTECAKILLAHGADPAARDNCAIVEAATYGHAECVELLLEDGRVDPTAQNDSALSGAVENGHAECAQLLLVDGRIDPGSADNFTICHAAGYGHEACIRLLLADPRVDPRAVDPEYCHSRVYGLIKRVGEFVDKDLADFQEINLNTLSDVVLLILILRNRANPEVKHYLMEIYTDRHETSTLVSALMSAISRV